MFQGDPEHVSQKEGECPCFRVVDSVKEDEIAFGQKIKPRRAEAQKKKA
jgi:predicted Fe-Mo cluster-binding NifX family protein